MALERPEIGMPEGDELRAPVVMRRLFWTVSVGVGLLISLSITFLLFGVLWVVVSGVGGLFPDTWLGMAAKGAVAVVLIGCLSIGAHRDWVKKGRPKMKWYDVI